MVVVKTYFGDHVIHFRGRATIDKTYKPVSNASVGAEVLIKLS